ncbi:MAG: FmdE family protein [Methanomicrobiaceae archaeon]|nr:FmdE family protein [Methanomicrobiaceae archaeon]
MKGYFERCIDFHTYPAPGLLIGVFMVDYAVELLGAVPGEKLYAVSETNKCAPDPLQVILNCTSGNHRLRIIPIGKFAITVNRPSAEPFTDGIRVFVDPGKIDRYPVIKTWFTNDPSFGKKTMGQHLVDEIFFAGRDILSAEKVRVQVTPKQQWQSARCRVCGETVPEEMLEQGVCRGCGSMAYYERYGAAT